MRVTRLEIFGFKSFVDRFVLNFDKNMIGIVGPNGCGKSNIVDALRWVLGETHAKQLRGGSFDDLIFNGSDSRRQLGMAEVSLTIRPEANWKSAIEDETSESTDFEKLDQSLDDVLSAPDVLDIKIANEIANDSDFIDADQNNISENVNDQSHSISKSNSRLDLVASNVMAIPGLFDASEIQFTRRLYRSGESEYFINKSACRLRDMHDLYRLIGLGARGLSIVQQGHIGQFISKKPIERRELLEEAAGISGFRNKMEAASRRLEKTDENLARVADILIEVEKQVKSLRRQATRAKARQSLKDELSFAEKELYKIKSGRLSLKINEAIANIESNSQEIEGLRASVSEKDSSILELEAALHEIDVQLMSLRREKDEHSRIILAEENRLQETRIKLATLDSNQSHLKEREEHDKARLVLLNNEIEELKLRKEQRLIDKAQIEENLESKRLELQELEQKHVTELEVFQQSLAIENQGSNDLTEMNTELLNLSSLVEELELKLQGSKAIEHELVNISQSLKAKERVYSGAETALTKIRSEAQAIEKQLSSLASHTIKAISGEVSEDSGRVLLSLLTIPEDLEKAVHAVLGEKANFLVVDNVDDRLKAYLGNNGKSSRLGLVDSKSRSQQNTLANNEVAGIVELISKVSYLPEDEFVVRELLKNVWLAESLDAALDFKIKLLDLAEYSIVLKSGEVLTRWGWYTTEGEGLHFSFTRRKVELLQEEEKQIIECEKIKDEVAVLEDRQTELKAQVQIINDYRANLSQAQRQLSSMLKLQGDEEKKYFQLMRDKEQQLRSKLRDIEKECSKEIVGIEQHVYKIISDISNVESQETKLNQECSALHSLIEGYPDKLEAINLERDNLLRSSVEANQLASSQESIDRRSKITELEVFIEEHETNRLLKHQAISEVKLGLSDFRRNIEAAYSALRTCESEKDRSEIELDMLKQDFARYYPDDSLEVFGEDESGNLSELLENIDPRIEELVETSNSIRKRLEREGEVDPQSIELCEQEEQRLESMTMQARDLTLAKETLERTIKQLKELSKVRFVNTFTAVNSKFKELIPRLFSGGSGYLELVNPEDPLQSGVEIVVRPPGKKITTMELMSGGEKALVATAVLVSMFLHHPGPICVLDEIDAPLDDANLVKLLDLIQEISHRTQFLVITHNKITMQAVDRLIGITMQESGITTALTVTLAEAEKELDRLVANA